MPDNWISTEDRLPVRDDGYVLIWIDWNRNGLAPALRIGWYDEGERRWRTQLGRLESDWIVTHWMPLPEGP